MSIDPLKETTLPFSAAARRVPSVREGKPVSPATLWRWASTGVLDRNGKRVCLEIVRVGGTAMTSLEALNRFFAALSCEPVAAPEASGSSVNEQTECALDAAGI